MIARIRADMLSKSFEPHSQGPLKDFSIEVVSQERVALIGPSGGGKSTLLRILAGTIQPDSGEVHCSFLKRAISFQEPRLIPWLSVEQNVQLAIASLGLPNVEQTDRVADALRIVSLEDARFKYPHQLSGGMSKRVSIARALASHAELLILDEPFSSVDYATRFSTIERMRRQFPDTTIIYVTHDPQDLQGIASRVIIVDGPPLSILCEIRPDNEATDLVSLTIEKFKSLAVQRNDVKDA
jgi:ABC-type nitrate/sulfonate/bicarbonate transport system ATPase subunit